MYLGPQVIREKLPLDWRIRKRRNRLMVIKMEDADLKTTILLVIQFDEAEIKKKKNKPQ